MEKDVAFNLNSIEKFAIKKITSRILEEVANGHITGTLTFNATISPIGRRIIASVARNKIVVRDDKLCVDWNWSHLV